MKRISANGVYTAKRSAQSYLCASTASNKPEGACGSACGAGDGDSKPETKPAACGSACGTGEK
jgi:ACGX-repeat protein